MFRGLLSEEMKAIESNRSIVCGSLLYGNMAGLESDIGSNSNTEVNSMKIELEIEDSRKDLDATALEIEVCIKIMNRLEKQISLDENALDKERVNKDVVDYSISSYNQLSKEHELESLELSGMESAIDNIKEGFKYVINNKIEVLKKVWEKIKALYEDFIKKIKAFWKKMVLSFMQFQHYAKVFAYRLSPYPKHAAVDVTKLSVDTLYKINRTFCIPALSNPMAGHTYRFNLGKATDLDKIREVFSRKMFIDIDSVVNDGKLKSREVQILTYISNPDILKKHFDLSTKGLAMSFDKSMPINFADDLLAVAFSDNGKFENIVVDRQEDNLNLAVDMAKIRQTTLENTVVDLGTYQDLTNFIEIVDVFLKNDVKPALSQADDAINKVNAKIKEYQDELAKANNISALESKLNNYKGIYNILKNIIEMSVLCTYRYTGSTFKTLDAITKDIEAANAAQNPKP